MNEEFPPTELTVKDIDRVMQKWEEDAKKPMPMVHCSSCNDELPLILTDYITGQCDKCFYARKPWISTCPVRDAYFQVINDE